MTYHYHMLCGALEHGGNASLLHGSMHGTVCQRSLCYQNPFTLLVYLLT